MAFAREGETVNASAALRLAGMAAIHPAWPSSCSRVPPASPTAVAKPEIFCQTVMDL
jgi:hypothetical protein